MKNIIFAMLFVFLSAGRVLSYDDEDFQVWNTDVEEFKLSKNLKAAIEEEFRWGNNADEFFYHHYDAGMVYVMNEHWNLGGGYRQIYELSKGKFKKENEAYLTATLSLEEKGFKFDSRNRLEYRHFDYKTDSWRYRNKFTLYLPWKFTKLQVRPYLADEILAGFGAGKNALNQNRLSAGLSVNLTKSFKGEIYYMRLSTKSTGRWSNTNVLGTKFRIVF